MALQIIKPEEKQFCKGLFFSPGGNGKTTLLGSAQLDARTSPMLLLDFEGGTESLTGLDIDVAPIRSWDDYNEAYELLASEDHGYKSLGIDSISETHIFALLDILEHEGPTRKDPELLEQRDYGKATVQMRRLLRTFRDLPMHVFFTSHAKEVEIPRQGRVQLPSLSGQMAEEVSGLMSVVGYLATYEETEGDEVVTHRTLLLKNFPRFRTKVRTPWGVTSPDELIDPTITDLLDMLGYPMPDEVKTVVKPSRKASPKPSRHKKAPEAKKPAEEEQPPEPPVEDDSAPEAGNAEPEKAAA